ncbi:MAG: 3-hydroxybutyrate dehydrogenase [Candidatus Eremiobacteraeota bacterium]|nr:3-hydroxybutyrate dehydrogenase [Candidatus Eremiobacteraeota bacterium]MCW5872515.1 3-hydroxybutyrate dehydrogenase [Candidatus Eremiobacteraeota bacterium]
MDLQGKTALVTGSTSGIGLGIARALAGQGMRLIFNGLATPEQEETVRGELTERSGQTALYWEADLRLGAELLPALHDLGPVDVLVNNAGIQHTAPIEEFPPERWESVLALNLSAAFYTIHALLPAMNQRGWGRIINVASAHGLVASVHKAAYVAAKHGLLGLTKVVALEQAGRGVTCNALCPGWVLTPLVQQQIEARAVQEGISLETARHDLLLEKQPSGHFTTVEQLGQWAVFLCSPACDNVTGTSLPVDGGWTAR